MAEREDLALAEVRLPEPLRHRAGPLIDLGVEGSDTYSYLRTYWNVLAKRPWTILTVSLVVTTLAAIYSFRMRPVYEATARAEVEAETPQIQSLNDLARAMPSDDAFLQTQVRVLESENLAWQTIQQLRLAENPEFNNAASGQRPASLPVVTQTLLVQAFKNHLRVELVRNSRIVEVNFQSTDRNLAAQVANALISNYMEYNFHKKYDATRQASKWMEQQLDELKANVEKSQQAMVDYERKNAIVNISDKQNVVEQRLSEISANATRAQSERIEKETLYESVKANESQVAFISQNLLLQKLEEKHADLKGEYADALRQYGPNFPRVLRLRDQLNEYESIIERERKRIVAKIRSDYESAVAREKLLTDAVAKQTAAVGNLYELMIEHNILKREFETNQQLYENLLQRLKDATLSAGLRATNIHVVDPALPPVIPVRPKKLLNIVIGLMIGTILGITIAFVQETLDNSVKTSEDVERLIPIPTLAVIPAASSTGPRQSWLARRGDKLPANKGEVELTVLNEPGSPIAEAYRSLRTAILLSTTPHPPQTLLVTSTQPSEGKTCTSLNLALALAQRGAPTLIIDADLRKPRIAPALGLPEGKGLSSFLTGAHGLEEALQRVEVSPNLWLLPAGPRPPNPAELLSSSGMGKVLRDLAKRFEHIVLDSPPLLLVTDATILSTLVDGVVLVVESGVTPRAALARAYRLLENSGGRILGVLMNKTDLRRDGYYGYSYHGYYYSYGGESSVAGTAGGNDQADAKTHPVPPAKA